ncbi:hypothetical protein ACP8Y2_04590 [Herpetosiphon llansteffanensis]
MLNIAYIGRTAAGKLTNLKALAKQLPQHIRQPLNQVWIESGFYYYQLGLHYGGHNLTLNANHGAILFQKHQLYILNDADGVVFVLDSNRELLEQNILLLRTSCSYLAQQGRLAKIAKVIQFNKHDLPAPDLTSLANFQHYCNSMSWPSIGASAVNQQHCIETLDLLLTQV